LPKSNPKLKLCEVVPTTFNFRVELEERPVMLMSLFCIVSPEVVKFVDAVRDGVVIDVEAFRVGVVILVDAVRFGVDIDVDAVRVGTESVPPE
jgi:hypothetical protein